MAVEDTGGDESGHGVAKLLKFGGIGLSGRGGGGTVAFHCGGVAGRRGGHPPQAGAPTLGSRRCGAGWLVCGGSAVDWPRRRADDLERGTATSRLLGAAPPPFSSRLQPPRHGPSGDGVRRLCLCFSRSLSLSPLRSCACAFHRRKGDQVCLLGLHLATHVEDLALNMPFLPLRLNAT